MKRIKLKKLVLCIAALMPCALFAADGNSDSRKPEGWGDTPVVKYPETSAIFYGEDMDLSREWNPCTGRTDGGVTVQMKEVIRPIENCPGEYVIVRRYTYPDGTFIAQQIRRMPRD